MKPTLSILLLVAFLNASVPASAQIVADFTAGQESDPPDEYADAANGDWASPWVPKRADPQAGVARNVIDTAPLSADGGKYLSVTTNTAKSSFGIFGVSRRYAENPKMEYNGVIRNQPHTISFQFRIDELSDFHGRSCITIGDLTRNDEVSGIDNNSAWCLRAHATASGSANEFEWAVYNGDRDGTFDVNKYVNTGIALATGVTYTVKIELVPESGDWTISLSDGTKSFTSEVLGFRTQNHLPTGCLGFYRESVPANSLTAFSLDNVVIKAP
jgi:hypothetical protein